MANTLETNISIFPHCWPRLIAQYALQRWTNFWQKYWHKIFCSTVKCDRFATAKNQATLIQWIWIQIQGCHILQLPSQKCLTFLQCHSMHWLFFNTVSQLNHTCMLYNMTYVPVWIIYHCFIFAFQDDNPQSMIAEKASMEFLIYMIKIRRTQEKTHCCSIGLLSFQKIMFESTRPLT